MTENTELLQFAELIRSSVQGAQVMIWLGDAIQVRNGALPALLMVEICPACHEIQPHLLSFMNNWNQFTCLVCDFKHSEQLVRQGGGHV